MIENIPNLLIPGFAKCGTTTLGFMLRQHPQIELPDISKLPWTVDVKEPGFFLNLKLDYCKNAYKGNCLYQLDGTPSYHLRNPSLAAIAAQSENQKSLVIMRDPIKRAVSHWNHFCQLRHESHPSAQSWPLNVDFTFDQQVDHELSGGAGDLLARSLYVAGIKRMLQYFGRKQIHFCFMEDMARDPIGFFNGIFDFLEIESVPVKMAIKNARTRVFTPSQSALTKLGGALYGQVPELKKYTGHIPDEWGS